MVPLLSLNLRWGFGKVVPRVAVAGLDDKDVA